MTPEDIKKAPKIFCENVTVGFSKEFFVFSLRSGEESDVFTFTPQHAKRLQQYLNHQITDFENQYGEIKADWNPAILSPLQRTNPPTPGS